MAFFLRSILKFSSQSVLSKATGFLRDLVLANVLGIGILSDIFFVAFKLPNIFRTLVSEGTLNAALTPLYTEKQTSDSKQERSYFINNTFSTFCLLMFCICTLGVLLMPGLFVLVAPGIDIEAPHFREGITAARIMFPYLGLITLCSVLCAFLQTHHAFGITAGYSTILNIGMILFATGSFLTAHPAMHCIAFGVLTSGILQLAVLIFYVRRVMKHRVAFIRPRLNTDIHALYCRALPTMFGACVTRASLWIDTLIASIVSGAVSYLYYAERLCQIPRSLIGVAIGTVVLPELTRALRKKKHESALRLFNRALELGYLLCIPAAVGLVILAPRITSLLFLHFQNQEHIQNISQVILYSSLSIPAVTTLYIANTWSFARGDTKAPAKIAAIALAINIVTNCVGIRMVSYLCIPIATAVSSWTQVILLFRHIRKKHHFVIEKQLSDKLGIFCVAACVMAFGLYIIEGLATLLGPMPLAYFSNVALLGVEITLGGMTYFATLYFTKFYSLHDLKHFFSL